jgi:hypothetical protein
MVVRNGLDRSHLASDAIDRVAQRGYLAAYAKQATRNNGHGAPPRPRRRLSTRAREKTVHVDLVGPDAPVGLQHVG